MDIGNHHLWWLGRSLGMEGLIMNQPAFPQLNPVANEFHAHYGKDRGMTLRDYFAAKAMQGFMANKANPMHFQPENDSAWAYTIADAMMKAREA
jgi:hypothetical protein